MKKSFFLTLWIVSFFSVPTLAQDTAADSVSIRLQDWNTEALERKLQTAKEDTTKVILLNELSWRSAFSQPEKGLSYFRQSLALSNQLKYKRGLAHAYSNAAWCQITLGNYNFALQLVLKSLPLFEELKEKERVAWVYLTLANIYRDFGDLEKALQMAHQSIKGYNELHISARIPLAVAGSIYELQNRLDSAFIYVNKAQVLDKRDNAGKWGWIQILLGNIYKKRKEYDLALQFYRAALPITIDVNVKKDIVDIYTGMAQVHQGMGQLDSSIYYANEIVRNWRSISYHKGVLSAYNILSDGYKAKNEKDSTIKYLELSTALKSKLFTLEKQRDIQNLAFSEQMRQEAVERERQQSRNQLKLLILLGLGLVLLVIAGMLWRHNLHRKRAYLLLQQQKQETDRQKMKAEEALQELQATQAQLIQKEKMASLGELTAGIAHEIQNPLNFVTNFSEVNQELLSDLQGEIAQGNLAEARTITEYLIENEKKINQHGQRADRIVKGMLQHSRSNTGEKQLTDVNSLVEEYLRLSYHGLRTKDKDFNANLITEFDKNLGKIEVVPQELSRVFLNLFNNAFYATQQKKAQLNGQYHPEVKVTTCQHDGKIEIRVYDNGTGIPENVKAKIFQPFFTTKPTGQGTGLGLSLSYDIITKSHRGELKVETKEGEFSEFIVQLPG